MLQGFKDASDAELEGAGCKDADYCSGRLAELWFVVCSDHYNADLCSFLGAMRKTETCFEELPSRLFFPGLHQQST